MSLVRNCSAENQAQNSSDLHTQISETVLYWSCNGIFFLNPACPKKKRPIV